MHRTCDEAFPTPEYHTLAPDLHGKENRVSRLLDVRQKLQSKGINLLKCVEDTTDYGEGAD